MAALRRHLPLVGVLRIPSPMMSLMKLTDCYRSTGLPMVATLMNQGMVLFLIGIKKG